MKFGRYINLIEYAEFGVGVIFFHLIPEILFLNKFGTKSQMFHVRFGSSSKSSMQNSRMMLILFLFWTGNTLSGKIDLK